MNCYEIRENGYTGQVWPSTSYPKQFYFYSISRSTQHEQLAWQAISQKRSRRCMPTFNS